MTKEEKRKYDKAYHQANKERRYKRLKDWEIANPEKYIIHRKRKEARKLGVDFNLEVSDIIIPKICPVLGIPIFRDNSPNHYHSPSVDRTNPKLGYVKGNIQIISNRANILKREMTLEELVKFGDWAKKLLLENN